MKIKPTGLKGNDKIQRIQNLMSKLTPINESTENSSLEHVKYGPDGIAYGIIRENHTYFIKTSNKNSEKLSSNDFEYIGGLQNKMTESYRSYEDALRHLNMKFRDLNESYNIRENINLFKSDLITETKKEKIKKEQDEETTYKLKLDSPENSGEGVSTEPATDTTSSEVPEVSDVPSDMPDTDTAMDMDTDATMDTDTESSVGEDSGDLEKDIQRLTGKIGQKMRELDEPNPELEKYVINSIMSALDVESMDEDFKEDLISKLEGEEEETEETTEEPAEEETEETTEEPAEEETEEIAAESRIITKKTIMEKLKSKKLLKNKLKRSVNEYFYYDENMTNDYEDDFSDMEDSEDMFSSGRGDWEDESFEDRDYYREKFKPSVVRKHKMLKNPNLYDDEEMLDEVENMLLYGPNEKPDFSKMNSGQKFGVKTTDGKIKTLNVEEMNEDENIYEIELDEDWMEEGNKFTDMLRKTKKGGTFKIGGKTYKDTSDYDGHKKRRHMEEDEDIYDDFEEFDLDVKKPLHNKPFDLSSVSNRSNFDVELEEELKMFGEMKSNKPTTAPPPTKTPTKPTRRERTFKPSIKPKIQPKGEHKK